MQIRKFYILFFAFLAIFSNVAKSKDTGSLINYYLQVPTVIENGAVVPVNIRFDPPLTRGKSFSIFFNKEAVANITIQEGQLIEFMTRLKMSEEITTTSVKCSNCTGDNITSEVKLTAPLSTVNSMPEKILLNSRPGIIRVLVTARNTINGNFGLVANGLNINVVLTKNLVSNPFFSFRGSIQRGESCATYQSSEKISQCIMVERDAPKDSGKQVLLCESVVGRNLRSSELEIDFDLSTINGHPAEITESEIRWRGGSNVESVLSRLTGDQRIISIVDTESFRKGQILITGKCQPVQNKPTTKLF